MQRLILALADDLTGALEVGAKFAEHALHSKVITNLHSLTKSDSPVWVIDTETRHLPADEAGERIRRLATFVRGLSPWLIYKKTDSTLRGNIAAEFGAIQDVFPAQRIFYVPAYPDMGRTVQNGELFVWGVPVHRTEFANDRWSLIVDCRIGAVLGDVPVVLRKNRIGSSCRGIPPILVMQAAENWFGDHS